MFNGHPGVRMHVITLTILLLYALTSHDTFSVSHDNFVVNLSWCAVQLSTSHDYEVMLLFTLLGLSDNLNGISLRLFMNKIVD